MKQNRLFILLAALTGFCITSEYAIVRPVSNSFFLSAYGAYLFPYAYLAMVPLNFALVALYNWLLPRLGIPKTFFLFLGMILSCNLFSAFFIDQISWWPFAFWIWKEIYVLLSLQQLWSMIHASFEHKSAKYLYGIFFGVGGLGGALGSSIPGFFATSTGSKNLLFFAVALSLCLGVLFLLTYRRSNLHNMLNLPKEQSLTSSMKLFSTSKALRYIFALVLLMQVTSTLVDFQFNQELEKAISQTDLRTQFIGRVMASVNAITIPLQFIGSFLLVHLLGIHRGHLLIPSLLCLNALTCLLFPLFGVITYSLITIKTFDFSLFGVLKEMLYLPLTHDEKFRAKAFIDIFSYRSAKALASLLIIILQLWSSQHLSLLLSWSSVGLFILWITIVGRKKYDLQFTSR